MHSRVGVRDGGFGRVHRRLDDQDGARLGERLDPHDRLAQAKTTYDPQNVFRVNQNIQPAV